MNTCPRCELRKHRHFDASFLCWPCRVEYSLDNPDEGTVADMVSHAELAVENLTPELLLQYFKLPIEIQIKVAST